MKILHKNQTYFRPHNELNKRSISVEKCYFNARSMSLYLNTS